jgi:hypothetical protein
MDWTGGLSFTYRCIVSHALYVCLCLCLRAAALTCVCVVTHSRLIVFLRTVDLLVLLPSSSSLYMFVYMCVRVHGMHRLLLFFLWFHESRVLPDAPFASVSPSFFFFSCVGEGEKKKSCSVSFNRRTCRRVITGLLFVCRLPLEKRKWCNPSAATDTPCWWAAAQLIFI